MMHYDDHEELIGQCFHCGIRGPLGLRCTSSMCEDSGAVYEDVLWPDEDL